MCEESLKKDELKKQKASMSVCVFKGWLVGVYVRVTQKETGAEGVKCRNKGEYRESLDMEHL